MKFSVVKSEIIFHEFFTIERARVLWEQFNGTMGKDRTRYVIRRGESVGIIPLYRKNDTIVLIKQFRYPSAGRGFDGYLWEIPAGMVNRNENPYDTARRELFEEIGVKVKDVKKLISFFLSPGALDEKFHLYFAVVPDCEQINSFGGNQVEYEDLKIGFFHKAELVDMVLQNKIADAKTIAGLLYYFSFGANKKE